MSAWFKKILRAVLVRSLMIGGLLGVTVAVGTTPASAKATNAKTVSCAGLRDDGSGTGVLLSQCTGSGLRTTGATGLDIFVSRSRAKVTWSTGKTSLLSFYRYIYPTDDCPNRTGMTKLVKVTYRGRVTGGTAKRLVGGHYSSTVCAYEVIGGFAAFPVGPQIY